MTDVLHLEAFWWWAASSGLGLLDSFYKRRWRASLLIDSLSFGPIHTHTVHTDTLQMYKLLSSYNQWNIAMSKPTGLYDIQLHALSLFNCSLNISLVRTNKSKVARLSLCLVVQQSKLLTSNSCTLSIARFKFSAGSVRGAQPYRAGYLLST